MASSKPPRGMRDFLPDQVRKRDYVIGVIKSVYEKYGFEPLETPAVENLSTLSNKYGEEGDQLMYKILKRGEKLSKKLESGQVRNENDLSDLALRYDLTVPLARVMANYRNELPRFFKRYQIQPVWRADRPARGRFREFYQCDVDAIGSRSMLVEAELCTAVCEILEGLGFDDYLIKLNNRVLLFAILESAGIEAGVRDQSVVILDKLEKIGPQKVIEALCRIGVSAAAADSLLGLFSDLGKLTVGETISAISAFAKDSSAAQEALKEIGEVAELSGIERLKVDCSLARGLSYYTGAIIEVVLTGGDFSGSVAGGGRYDELIGMFGKEEIPAVGLSIGLERIILIMEERGMFPESITTSGADVLVTLWNEDAAADSLKLASELRSAGKRVLVYPEPDKLGKQFKYADQIGVKTVCVLGESEIKDKTVTIKNLKTGNQETVSRETAAEAIDTALK
ncbi:MAG: histidine--tRNA ligase [Acidobacteriota bacterium]|nr:histidine--tRNA ligase [Acidobacteriota bacterium]